MRKAASWDGREVEALRQAWSVPRLEAYERIGSTNDRAAELARAGAPAWTVVVADEQTTGRGRRGTTWVSPPGAGLWMSVLLGDGGWPGLPLVVGLACAEAIESLAPDLQVGIKWPNDLLLDGVKVGGILCETVGGAVAAGIGINVTRAPDEVPATSLEMNTDKILSHSVLAGSILARLRARTGHELRADGGLDARADDPADPRVVPDTNPLAAAHGELARRDVLAGARILTEQEGPGRGAGIDESGALRLQRPDGSEVRVVSGGVRLQARERTSD